MRIFRSHPQTPASHPSPPPSPLAPPPPSPSPPARLAPLSARISLLTLLTTLTAIALLSCADIPPSLAPPLGDCLSTSLSNCTLAYQKTDQSQHSYQTTTARGVFEAKGDIDVWHGSLPLTAHHTIVVAALPSDPASTDTVANAITQFTIVNSLANNAQFADPLIDAPAESLAEGHYEERFFTNANVYHLTIAASQTITAKQAYRITITQTDPCVDVPGMRAWLAHRNDVYVEPHISRGICGGSLGTAVQGDIAEGNDAYLYRLARGKDYQVSMQVSNVTESTGSREYAAYVYHAHYDTFGARTNVNLLLLALIKPRMPTDLTTHQTSFNFLTPPGTDAIDVILEVVGPYNLLNGQYSVTISETPSQTIGQTINETPAVP